MKPGPQWYQLALRLGRPSAWAFPLGLLVIVCVLAAFRISGTSVGMYHQIFYGGTADARLLYGNPLPIRSDEWLVVTPLTVAQSRVDYQQVNPNIGSGLDASVLLDLPYKDWSAAFKPQNWPFFVLPLEQAFALKWWFISFLLVVSVYALSLLILPKQRLVAVLVSLGFLASPFLQWWYQTMTLAAVFWPCLAVVSFVYLTRARTARQVVLGSLALAYVLSCFALLLYPPFQIPGAMAGAAAGLGLWLRERGEAPWRKHLQQLLPALVSVALAGAVVVAFFATRAGTIEAITSTIYPGHRTADSGGFAVSRMLDGFVSFELQRESRIGTYESNQSEDSNFVMLWPYLFIPAAFIVVRDWRERRRLHLPILLVSGLLVLLTARVFLPLPDTVAKLALLSSIPHNRLLIGFGFLNLLLLLLVMREVKSRPFPHKWALGVGGLAIGVQFAVGLAIRQQYPQYISRSLLILALATVVGAIVYLVMSRKAVAATALLLVLGLFSTVEVHPLYRGLGELNDTKMFDAAESVAGGQDAGWAFVGDVTTINLLSAGGIHSYAATYPYPQKQVLKALDPEGKYDNVYNRYAFANFAVPSDSTPDFGLYGFDNYYVEYFPCERRFSKLITKVMSQSQLADECLMLVETVSYPNRTFYVYSVRR